LLALPVFFSSRTILPSMLPDCFFVFRPTPLNNAAIFQKIWPLIANS
jgi:hypothetical protein